jgi:hypothetical protein
VRSDHVEPLEVIVDELVNRYINSKIIGRHTSVALDRIAAEVGEVSL